MSLELAIDTTTSVLDSLSQLAITSTDSVWLKNDTLVVIANYTQKGTGGFSWWNVIAWIVIMIAAITPHYLHVRHERKIKVLKEKEELIGALTAVQAIFIRNKERLDEALENLNRSKKERSFFSVTYRLITVDIDSNILFISQRLNNTSWNDLIKKLVYLYEEHHHINSWLESIRQEIFEFRKLCRGIDLIPEVHLNKELLEFYAKLISREQEMFFKNLNGAIAACENIFSETKTMIQTLEEYIKVISGNSKKK